MTRGDAILNGIRIHWLEEGDGPPVILLHGFPELSSSWRRVVPMIAAAGYRAVAPDLRGYGLSERPRGVAGYRIEALVEDLAALSRKLGGGRAHIVGHDWGGVIAFAFAAERKDLVEKLVVLNAPHPAAFRREIFTPAQLRRSWYIFFFQLPWLPEALFSARRCAALRRDVWRGANRASFSAEDIDAYVEAFSKPGALEAAMNYYRAARFSLRREIPRIDAPTLLVWGERDLALGAALTEGLEPHVPHLRVERLPGATHWVHHDEPERVGALIVEFLGRQSRISPMESASSAG